MSDFKYDMVDVLGLLNLPANKKAMRMTCPKCGQKDLCVNLENEKFVCHHDCGFQGRGGTLFYALYYDITTKQAYHNICSELHIDESNHNVTEVKPRNKNKPVFEKENPIAQRSTRNKVYRMLLHLLVLTEEHRQLLRERGLTNSEIDKLGYRSSPQDNNNLFEIPKKIISAGYNLEGVPGFFKTKNKGVWCLSKRKKGILVPYVDFNNQITGIQVRKNDEVIDYENNERKYGWISSTNLNEGASAGGFLHFACDFHKKGCSIYPDLKDEKVFRVTEGGMKADIYHMMTGLPIAAVPGVNILEDFQKMLPYIKKLGVETIENVFDMDYLTNPKVKKAQDKFEQLVLDAGLKFQRKEWKTSITGHENVLKGIDDYVAYTERHIIPKK